MSHALSRTPRRADPPERWADRRPGTEDVRACYRILLGREAEDEGVLARHAAAVATNAELRARIMASEEFRQALAGPVTGFDGPGPEPDLAATEEELDRLIAIQAACWDALGEAAPHWSTLPEPRFRPERFEASRRAFYASGADEVAALLATLGRAGIAAEELSRVVEHGCGVGRVTLHLAAQFPEVTGVDVSAAHLAAGRRELDRRGLVHIRWLRARAGALMPARGYDLWFSRRTLQWNPPPLTRRVLEFAFAGLAPGGVAVFQLPTWCAGYRFSTAGYLAAPPPEAPELHLLPQAEVFRVAAGAGLQVLGVWEDSHLPVPGPSPWRSQLFVLRKPR
jgi:SAM-dependent methyltransferase